MTPAPVDHDERRARLAEVLFRIVDERGVDGASIRALAQAAGVSIGTVQHYFATKDDLLRHAYALSEQRISARIERRLEGVADVRTSLRGIVLEFLPLDAERTSAIRVASAFGIRGLYDARIEPEVAGGLAELREIVTGLFAQAGVADPRLEAVLLLAVADGLTDQLLFPSSGIGPDEAVAAVDQHLHRVLGRDV